jgi:Transposase DDE domain
MPFDPAMKRRFRERTTAERGNSRLKDEFGCRQVRVRGHAKVHLHLMFGVLALFADQLFKIFKPDTPNKPTLATC